MTSLGAYGPTVSDRYLYLIQQSALSALYLESFGAEFVVLFSHAKRFPNSHSSSVL